jgi:hypothetical protein
MLDELFGLEMAGRAVEALGGYLKELLGERVCGLAVEVGGRLGRCVGGGEEDEKECEKGICAARR